MSKPKPPRGPAAAPTTASTRQITPDSSHVEILREKVRVRTEILRRYDYQELLRLKTQLAGMPPAPPSHDAPANED